MPLLLILSIFHTFFQRFYCWIWTGKCLNQWIPFHKKILKYHLNSGKSHNLLINDNTCSYVIRFRFDTVIIMGSKYFIRITKNRWFFAIFTEYIFKNIGNRIFSIRLTFTSIVNIQETWCVSAIDTYFIKPSG